MEALFPLLIFDALHQKFFPKETKTLDLGWSRVSKFFVVCNPDWLVVSLYAPH
jgi:hypothetical protein